MSEHSKNVGVEYCERCKREYKNKILEELLYDLDEYAYEPDSCSRSKILDWGTVKMVINNRKSGEK